VATSTGDVSCRTVVLASGACNVPSVPALCAAVPASIESVTPFDYRNPDHLPEGGVLVVGASATGVQLADEIHRSGRPVTLSVGEHSVCRGRIEGTTSSGGWTHRACGTSGDDEIDDLTRARRLPHRNWSARPRAGH
jgi:putative flavoprotein involved in K+ transport